MGWVKKETTSSAEVVWLENRGILILIMQPCNFGKNCSNKLGNEISTDDLVWLSSNSVDIDKIRDRQTPQNNEMFMEVSVYKFVFMNIFLLKSVWKQHHKIYHKNLSSIFL